MKGQTRNVGFRIHLCCVWSCEKRRFSNSPLLCLEPVMFGHCFLGLIIWFSKVKRRLLCEVCFLFKSRKIFKVQFWIIWTQKKTLFLDDFWDFQMSMWSEESKRRCILVIISFSTKKTVFDFLNLFTVKNSKLMKLRQYVFQYNFFVWFLVPRKEVWKTGVLFV